MRKVCLILVMLSVVVGFTLLEVSGQVSVGTDSMRSQGRFPQDTIKVDNGMSPVKADERDSIVVKNEARNDPFSIEMQKMNNYWRSQEHQAKLRAIRTRYETDLVHRVKDIGIRRAVQKEVDNIQAVEIVNYPESEYFYYNGPQKTPLRISEEEMAIEFPQELASDRVGNVLVSENVKSILTSTYGYRLVRLKEHSALPILEKINRVTQRSEVKRALPVFYKPDNSRVIIRDEIVVRFNESVTSRQRQDFNERFNLEIIRKMLKGNIYVLRLKDGKGVQTLRTSVECHNASETRWAHPNFYTQAKLSSTVFSDDPLLNLPILYQWNLHAWGVYPYEGPPNTDIDAPQAWGITKGDSGVKIAILDSGIELDHEDLSGNTTGIVHYDVSDSIHPKPQPTGSPDMSLMSTVPDNAHGTAVAGVAAAIHNNGVGISGVAPNCKIVSVRLGPSILYIENADTFVVADVNSAVIANAVLTAAYTAQAKVINMSFQAPGDPVLESAIQLAASINCVLVGATGNANQLGVELPAGYPEVIAVGATDFDARRMNFLLYDDNNPYQGSNYGPNIDVVAPGFNITTTDITGSLGFNEDLDFPGFEAFLQYAYGKHGTSFAAPHVSGLAALLFSIDSNYSMNDIRTFIRQGARDGLGLAHEDSVGVFDSYHGYGRTNAYNSLLLAKTELMNSNFEGDPLNSVNNINYWGNIFGDIEAVNGDGTGGGAYAGFQSLKVSRSSSGWGWANTYAGSYAQDTTVTVTAWVKGQPGTDIFFGIFDQFAGSDSNFVQIPYDDIPNPDGGEWRPIEIVHTMQSGTVSNPTAMWVAFAVNGSGGHAAYIDMVTVRRGHASKDQIVEGGFEVGASKTALGWQREINSPWAINNTWPLHNPQHGPQVGLEDNQCMGTQVPESGTGFLMSYPFKVTKPYINFKLSGHNGNPTSASWQKSFPLKL